MAKDEDPDGGLPSEFYAATVDSMFSDGRSLIIGALASCAVALAVALQYRSYGVAMVALALPLVAAARLLSFIAYFRRTRGKDDPRALQRWEAIYGVGASAHVLLLGAFCLLTFLDGASDFGRLASLTCVMAFLVGIPGRNFASPTLVGALIVCAAVPVISALVLSGGLNWVIAALVLLPFFAALRSISNRLRGIFFEANSRTQEVTELAGRFDSALNNMPCGLVMLDSRGRVAITNKRFGEMFDLRSIADHIGLDLPTLFADCVERRMMEADRLAQVLNGLEARIKGGAFEDLTLELNNGRVLDLTLQPANDGGAVVLFDDVTERNLAQARINELARFDPLTGLPNRVEFRDRAARLIAEREEDADVAVLFVDLDQFKQVNDTLGHAVGDQLLGLAADRLRQAAKGGDLVARLGGDEFVVFIAGADTLGRIETVARSIVRDMAKPFEIAGHRLRVGATVGVARGVDVGYDIGMLLRCADMALYQAKSEGRGAWRLFEAGMEVRARDRRELEGDLRTALENNGLELYFQPIYRVEKHAFLGCEALLRWRHPTRGFVPPSVFVPLAEEIGLIGKLDEFVLRFACQTAAKWRQPANVAVNISAVSFDSPEIVNRIRNELEASGLAPQRLEIELTETALLRNLKLTRSILSDVAKLGVRISLDDFGTGYSSLSYLHSLPLNKIKIDRSFLAGLETNPRALKLLRGVSSLSKDMGHSVVVEGVETQEQFALVTGSSEVDEIQGFLFSPPVPRTEIEKFFENKQLSAA